MSINIAPVAFEEIEYVMEPDDFTLFNLTFARRYGALKNRLIGQLGLLGLSIVTFVIGLFLRTDLFRLLINYALIFLILFLVFLLYTAVILPYSLKKRSVMIYNSCADYNKPRKMEIFDQVLRVSKRFTRDTYSWDDLHECLETTSCFCFYFDRNDPVGEALPKSVMTQQQVEKISEFLKEKLTDRYVID